MARHPERSEAQSKDPAAPPFGAPRDSSTSLGMTASGYLNSAAAPALQLQPFHTACLNERNNAQSV